MKKKIIWIILILVIGFGFIFSINLFLGTEPVLVFGPGWSIHKYVPTFNVYKNDKLVATIKPQPGFITSAATPMPDQKLEKHSFITASSFAPEEENNLYNLLNKAKDFNDYVYLLKENGYIVLLAHP